MPGVRYGTESGFYNPTLPGITHTAGLADFGTRILVRLTGVQPNVTLTVPNVVVAAGNPLAPTTFVLVATDGNGDSSADTQVPPIGGGTSTLTVDSSGNTW